ncbi:unnamed protein product, partial [Sphacelaria rigidula]
KQGGDEPKKVTLGRPGNNVKVGIVGVPNVGKSRCAQSSRWCGVMPRLGRGCTHDSRGRWVSAFF